MGYTGQAPKYVQVLEWIQDGIREGRYPLGSKLPSETEVIETFGCSRQVVIRAYQILEQDGWIKGEIGRGRTVLGEPEDRTAAHGLSRLAQGESDVEDLAVHLLSVATVKAPARAAHALGIKPGALVVARRRLIVSDEIGPVELSTAYIPADVARGSDAITETPLPEGVLEHLKNRKGIRWTRASETIAARLPSTEEAEALEIGPRDVLLTILVIGYDHEERPRLVTDILIPANRQVLEDSYPLT